MILQGQQSSVTLFQTIAERLAARLKPKTKSYFLPLILGVLLAFTRRRTVTTWIQAAQLSDDFRQVFYHMPNIGCKSQELFDEMPKIILTQRATVIMTAVTIRLVFDDTPTKRYGRKIEGAGYHYNPTPGKTDATRCFGHSWVVAALVITHPLFGEVSFPIGAELYLRQKEIDKLEAKYQRKFKKKTELVVEMVKRLVPKFKRFEKKIEIIIDGGYAKDTVLLPLDKLDNVITITRLRRDAAVFELPPSPTGGPGRPRVKGGRIDLKSMVESNEGWEIIECRLYGQVQKKRVKSFIAVSKLTKWKPVRVVLIKEDDGIWVPLMCTDITRSVKEILESYGVRFGIEEMFKDLKEIWGLGKQEVRLLERNEAATTMNMLLFAMTELSTWDRTQEELVDRSYRPWDDQDRRPSHMDRRNFLRRGIWAKELNAAMDWNLMPTKIASLLKNIMRQAA
jgi:hypothetical protein